MTIKSLKALLYVFIISLLAGIIISSATEKEDIVFYIIKWCCFGIALLVVLIYIYMMVYLSIDNKKFAKLLDNDVYDEIIKRASRKVKQKTILFADRKPYYNYLLLLCYLAKDETDKFDKYFDLVTDYFNYPVALYWKSVYHFSIGQMEGLEANYDSFVRSSEVQKRHAMFVNLIKIFEVMKLYKNEKYEEAVKMLESVDTEHISMPITLRAIQIIQDKRS